MRTTLSLLAVARRDAFRSERLGHIPDALNLPVGALPNRLTKIKALADKLIILVCRTDKRSASAAAILREAGFRDIRVLRGGMQQWNQERPAGLISGRGSGVKAPRSIPEPSNVENGAKQMMRLSNPMVATAGAAVAVVPTWVWAQAPSDVERYAYGPHMMWGYGMIFGPLFMILVLAVVIAVAVLLVRWLAGPWQGGSHPMLPGRTPLDILRERFARGEIDKDEFEERRRVLGD